MQRANLIWWRFGKEHERLDPTPPYLRSNSPERVVDALDQRLAQHLADAPENWRIWQPAPRLLVERAWEPSARWAGPDTFIHYPLDLGIAAMENFNSHSYGPIWYLHICEYFYDQQRACWVMKDLFTDILVRLDNTLLAVLDLDDLAEAQELGLVSAVQVNQVLRKTQQIVNRIRLGEFPFPEILQGQQACRALGWRDGAEI